MKRSSIQIWVVNKEDLLSTTPQSKKNQMLKNLKLKIKRTKTNRI